MSNRRVRRWALTSARVVIGTAVSAAFVVGVVFAVAADWPRYDIDPVAVAATPAADDTVIACAGPLLAIGRDSTQAAQLSVAASQTLTAPITDTASTAERSALSALSVTGAPEIAAFTAAPADGVRVGVAAAGSASVDADDLRGFAASACAPALTDSWLVAGAATTGAADLIVLANPGDVAATVTLTVYGGEGASVPVGGEDIVVAAGAQRVIPLAGIASGERSPVVRVSATGAPVAAWMQSSITRTLVPGGVEQTGAIPSATTQQVIPGIVVPDTAAALTESTTTVVRVLSPAAATTATVRVLSSAGEVEFTQELPVAADTPTELQIPGLSAGTHTVVVDSEQATVAGVWQATSLGEDADTAWYTSAPEMTVPSLVPVADGPGATLVLANTGSEDVAVAVTGREQSVLVPAGTSVAVAVETDEAYVIDPDGSIYANVVYSGDGQLSGYAVWPEDAAASTVTVYP